MPITNIEEYNWDHSPTNPENLKKWMRMAEFTKNNEKPCLSRSIGVIIVDPWADAVVSTGHNGPPEDLPPCDEWDYLKRVVVPQLTPQELALAVRGAGTDEELRDRFVREYNGCGICPRKLIGATRGQRLELCTCLSYESRVLLEEGTWEKIGRLVRDRYSGNVMSYDQSSKQFLPRQVTGWHELPFDGQWHKVITRYGRHGRHGALGAKFTGNHKILTGSGDWAAVEDLITGQKICTPEPMMSAYARQMVMGSCLGDGRLYKTSGSARFVCSHSAKHSEYVTHKADMLGQHLRQVRPYMRDVVTPNGKLYHHMEAVVSKSLMQLSELLNKMYDSMGGVSDWLLGQLDEVSLAYWYMDDGSLVSGTGCYIAMPDLMCRIDAIKRVFSERWGIHARLSTGGRLYFPREEAEKFFLLIRRHVIPAMQYKMPHGHRGCYNNPDLSVSGAFMDEVLEVQRLPRQTSRVATKVYCLDVDGTHNFCTINSVAHNCIHGETDAVTKARRPLFDCWMVCSCGVPCIECTKIILEARLKAVVVLEHGQGTQADYSPYSSRWMFERSKTELILCPGEWFGN